MWCTLAIYNKENARLFGEEVNRFVEILKNEKELLNRNPDLPIVIAAAIGSNKESYLKNKLISGDSFIYSQTIT